MLSEPEVDDPEAERLSDTRMSWLGIGPKFAICSLLYAAVVVGLHAAYPDAMTLKALPRLAGWIVGLVLIAAGFVLYVVSAIQLRSVFRNGELHTSGIYGHVHHPIYASFILLIVPGLVIIARSIPGITLPFAMYGFFSLFIREEERRLAAAFGEEYRKYRERVGSIIPRAHNSGNG